MPQTNHMYALMKPNCAFKFLYMQFIFGNCIYNKKKSIFRNNSTYELMWIWNLLCKN